MAGDWIKVEENMPDKPEVQRMAAILGIDPDAVAGKLLRVWVWATRNCNANGVTSVTVIPLLNRYTGVTGFAESMISVGWLVQKGDELEFPKFEKHCSVTAKERAETYLRVAKHRKNPNKKTGKTRVEKCNANETDLKRICNAKTLLETETETETEVVNEITTAKPNETESISKPSRLLPEHLRADWDRWMETYPHNPHSKGQRMPDIQQEAVIMELTRRGDDAAKDLAYTLQMNARSLLSHKATQFDHGTGRYRPPSTGGTGRKPTAQEQAAELKRQLGIGE